MANFLKNVRVSHAFIIVAAAPILAALIIASMKIVDGARLQSRLGDLAMLTELSVKMSDLVHEQQKERGATAVFIGSGGARFSTELQAQRLETDKKRAALEEFLANFESANHGTSFSESLSTLLRELNKMEEVRKAVTSFSISLPEAVGYYTNLNTKKLDLIANLAKMSADPRITTSIVGFTNYLQGKERAGIERALGAAGFAAGQFEPEVHNNFKSMINTQKIYNDVFLTKASDKQRALFEEVMSGQDAKEVQRMREVAIKGGLDGELEDITAEQWFDTISRKIESLKRIEDVLAEDLQAKMGAVQSEARNSLILIIASVLVALALAITLSVIIGKAVSKSLSAVLKVMSELADGNLEAKLPPASKNEIGQIVHALETFQRNGIEAKKLNETQEAENRDKVRRAQAIDEMVLDFDRKVGEMLDQVSEAVGQLTKTAGNMTENANATSNRSSAVATAAKQAAANVQTMAASTDELSSSVSEISMQINGATETANKAVSQAEESNEIVHGLSSEAEQIGSVVNLIQDIAEQTNLLALNATIEAARAGEAGKGFAVVASEVKSLASQTSKATEEIAQKISGIQGSTGNTADKIKEIANIIGQISEASTAIASAVEEQGAATQEIARNAQEVALGTQDVTDNISHVSSTAEETGKAAEDIMTLADNLSNQADNLKASIHGFLDNVRAA